MRRRLKLFSLVLSGKCCGVRMPRTRAAPTTRTPLSPACGCASTLDYAVLYRTISGIRNNRGSMCAMSCGYTTILYVYPACLYGAILRRIDNSQNLTPPKVQTACANEAKSRKWAANPASMPASSRSVPRHDTRLRGRRRASARMSKRRGMRRGLNGGTRTVSRRACTRCANRVDRTVRGCGPRSSSGSRAPGLAFRLDRTLISLDQTLISLDRTLITPRVCAASRHCAQRSQRHVLLSCRHVRCRLPARCPWCRLGLSLVLCRPRAHRVGSPTRRQV